jgi:hypothetical protein
VAPSSTPSPPQRKPCTPTPAATQEHRRSSWTAQNTSSDDTSSKKALAQQTLPSCPLLVTCHAASALKDARGSVALITHNSRKRKPRPPPMPLQVGNIRRVRNRPKTQPGNRPNRSRNIQQLPKKSLLIEADPPNTKPLSSGSQPKILNGQANRVQPSIRDRMPPQHRRRTPRRVVSDHNSKGGLQDPLNLDPPKSPSLLTTQRSSEHRALGSHMLLEGLAGHLVADDHEVPWLAQPHARCGMRRRQHPVQYLVVHRLPGELAAHVPPPADDLVEIHSRRVVSAGA